MVDPDAPTPENTSLSQILHWLQPGLTLQASSGSQAAIPYVLQASTPAVAPYARPMPPPYSRAHRYIQYLWAQPADFSIPPAFSGFSGENRTNFNISEFAAAAGLGSPLYANYFLCSNGTGAIAPNATGSGGTNGSIPAPTTTPFTGGASQLSMGEAVSVALLTVCFAAWML
jgi:phosphatidylethanolamine-binding protein